MSVKLYNRDIFNFKFFSLNLSIFLSILLLKNFHPFFNSIIVDYIFNFIINLSINDKFSYGQFINDLPE